MCGICGVIGMEVEETSRAIARRMMAALVHRGPDAEGILFAPPVAAGMRRLSIIDLPGGGQPVWNESETLAVIFNGEIYNFSELRTQLQSAGHQFRTHSDTEVIVHAYEEWGTACVERLHGMFAFAVVEMPGRPGGRATNVFLARDRLGIKPLYYTIVGGALLFASEVRALLASGCVPAKLSAEALPSYLLFGSVGEPLTLIDGVFSLPPGHFLHIPAVAPVMHPTPTPYWDIGKDLGDGAKGKSASRDRRESPMARVRSLLEESVRSHLIADVPVGVFLSSGIDSTAVAALASRFRAGVHTFTVGFPDAGFSEAEFARRTAERLGTTHLELNLTAEEMVSRLDEAVASFDQPSMDGINTYFVSWAARQAGLKVALSGLGSDEIFGGYSTFRATSNVTRLAIAGRFLPRSARQSISRVFESSNMFRSSPDKYRKASAAWLDPNVLPHEYFFTRLLFAPRAVASCTRKDRTSWQGSAWWNWLSEAVGDARAMDSFSRVSCLELRSYLVNTLLRDTDAMSMRHSLEVRVPFLDSALVRYVLSLSAVEKQHQGRPKSLLIEALGDLLPEETLSQQKLTFTFPWENWLRGELGRRVAKGLADWSPALEPHMQPGFALSVWTEFLEGRTSWSRPWSLYVLNEWAKQNLDGFRAHAQEQPATAVIINVI
jgi:asparagine synthase (glutamine-hydrolysing)